MMQTIGQGVLVLLVIMLTAIIAAALYGLVQLMGDFVKDVFQRTRAAIRPPAEQGDTPHSASPSHS